MSVADPGHGGFFWLASYPKSGNTWLRCFITSLVEGGDGPFDINALATDASAAARFWLDDVLGLDTAELDQEEVDRLRPLVYDWADDPDRIYYHKTHDAYYRPGDGRPLMHSPRTLGTVYVVRNPLDVASSYAHHNGTDVDRAIALMADTGHALAASRHRSVEQAREFMGTWSDHVSGWVDAPGVNLLALRYEDMLADPATAFGRAASFLRLPHMATEIAPAARRVAFAQLEQRERETGLIDRPPGMPRFFRAGVAGGWRDELNASQVARVIADHGPVMRRFGYLDAHGNPT